MSRPVSLELCQLYVEGVRPLAKSSNGIYFFSNDECFTVKYLPLKSRRCDLWKCPGPFYTSSGTCYNTICFRRKPEAEEEVSEERKAFVVPEKERERELQKIIHWSEEKNGKKGDLRNRLIVNSKLIGNEKKKSIYYHASVSEKTIPGS